MVTQSDFSTSVVYLDTQPPDTRPVLLSTSAAFIDKQPLKGKASFNLFAPQRLTLAALVSHVLAGRAWMPAASDARKRFTSAQALALDFDNKDGAAAVSLDALKQHPVVGQYAAFAYETPSSTPAQPRTRALFILDGTIATAQGYEAATRALMDLCADLHPDPACKDSARLYFGSKGAAHWTHAAVLPLSVIRDHAQDMARTARQNVSNWTRPTLTISTPSGSRAQARRRAYALKALDNNAAAIAQTPEHGGRFGGRNAAFHTLLCETLNLAYTLADTLSEHEIVDTLSRAARASGLPDAEIEAAAQSALRYPRETLRSVRVNFEDETPRRSVPPNMQRRPISLQMSARADISARPDLRYVPLDEDMPPAQDAEDAPYIDAWPTLSDEDTPPPIWADVDDVGESSVKARYPDDLLANLPKGSEAQTQAYILQNRAASDDYPGALPDAIIDAGISLYGKTVTIELNYLLSAQARRLLPKTFSLADVSAARAADGLAMPLSLRNTLKAMTDYGLLRRAMPDEFCMVLSYSLDRHGDDASLLHDKTMQNSKRGRRQTFYALVPLAEIKKRMARPAAAALMALHPEAMPTIEAAQINRVKRVLDGLQRRRAGLKTMSVGLVRAYLADDDKAHAEAVFEAIKAIPITDESLLMDMGLTTEEAAAARALLFNQDVAALIEAKNRIVGRLYAERLAALDNPHITPLAEDAPRLGDAWLNALRNARAQKHHNGLMSGYEMAQLLGVENVRSAYRAARKAGIQRHERVERRALDVKRIDDATPTTEVIRRAIKAACNGGEKAWPQRVFSYDEHGGVMDIQRYEDIEDLRIGVRFEVEVQLKSQITVEAAAPGASENLKKPEIIEAAHDEAQAEDTASAAAKEGRPRREHTTRIRPECLHSRQWLLARLLAPVCFNEALGVWLNPQTGEIHASAQDVLNDVMGIPPLAQAAEGVHAS
jgi:hypothetical protein